VKHFSGGGCSLGDEHAGPCEWAVTNNTAVTNTVTNNGPVSDTDRVLAWRAANRDKYNEYQREYMRKRRS